MSGAVANKASKDQAPSRAEARPRTSPRGPSPASAADSILALQAAAGNGAVSKTLQAGEGQVPPAVQSVLEGSGGQPLEPSIRALMESRFGEDLGAVRVHTDMRAGESARAIDAAAYTLGNQIVFAPDQYVPATPEGDRMLAHELAHVLQQRGQATAAASGVGAAGSGVEREADEAAAAAAAGLPARVAQSDRSRRVRRVKSLIRRHGPPPPKVTLGDDQLLEFLERFPPGEPITLYHVDKTGGLVEKIQKTGANFGMLPGEFWLTTNVETRTEFAGGAGLNNVLAFKVDRRYIAMLKELSQSPRAAAAAERGLKAFFNADIAVPRAHFEGGGKGKRLPEGDVNFGLRITKASEEMGRLFQLSVQRLDHLSYDETKPPGKRLVPVAQYSTIQRPGPNRPPQADTDAHGSPAKDKGHDAKNEPHKAQTAAPAAAKKAPARRGGDAGGSKEEGDFDRRLDEEEDVHQRSSNKDRKAQRRDLRQKAAREDREEDEHEPRQRKEKGSRRPRGRQPAQAKLNPAEEAEYAKDMQRADRDLHYREATPRAKQKLQRMTKKALEQPNMRNVRNHQRDLKRFERIARRTDLASIQQSKLRGDFDEAAQTSRRPDVEKQVRYVRGIKTVNKPTKTPGGRAAVERDSFTPGESSFFQPDATRQRRTKSGEVFTDEINRKADRVDTMTPSRARAAAKKYLKQAYGNFANQPGERGPITIPFAQTPNKEARKIILDKLHYKDSPVGDVYFGTEKIENPHGRTVYPKLPPQELKEYLAEGRKRKGKGKGKGKGGKGKGGQGKGGKAKPSPKPPKPAEKKGRQAKKDAPAKPAKEGKGKKDATKDAKPDEKKDARKDAKPGRAAKPTTDKKEQPDKKPARSSRAKKSDETKEKAATTTGGTGRQRADAGRKTRAPRQAAADKPTAAEPQAPEAAKAGGKRTTRRTAAPQNEEKKARAKATAAKKLEPAAQDSEPVTPAATKKPPAKQKAGAAKKPARTPAATAKSKPKGQTAAAQTDSTPAKSSAKPRRAPRTAMRTATAKAPPPRTAQSQPSPASPQSAPRPAPRAPKRNAKPSAPTSQPPAPAPKATPPPPAHPQGPPPPPPQKQTSAPPSRGSTKSSGSQKSTKSSGSQKTDDHQDHSESSDKGHASGHQVSRTAVVKPGQFGLGGSVDADASQDHGKGRKTNQWAGFGGSVMVNYEEVEDSSPLQYRVTVTINLQAKAGIGGSLERGQSGGQLSLGVSGALTHTFVHEFSAEKTQEYLGTVRTGKGAEEEMRVIRLIALGSWDDAKNVLAEIKGVRGSLKDIKKMAKGDVASSSTETQVEAGVGASRGGLGLQAGVTSSGKVTRSQAYVDGMAVITVSIVDETGTTVGGSASEGVASGGYSRGDDKSKLLTISFNFDPDAAESQARVNKLMSVTTAKELQALAGLWPNNVGAVTKGKGRASSQQTDAAVLGVGVRLLDSTHFNEEETVDAQGRKTQKYQSGGTGGGAFTVGGKELYKDTVSESFTGEVGPDNKASVEVMRAHSKSDPARAIGKIREEIEKTPIAGILGLKTGSSQLNRERTDLSGKKLGDEGVATLIALSQNKAEWDKKWFGNMDAFHAWVKLGAKLRKAGDNPDNRAAVIKAMAEYQEGTGRSALIEHATEGTGVSYEFPDEIADKKPLYDKLIAGDPLAFPRELAQQGKKDEAIANLKATSAKLTELLAAVESKKGEMENGSKLGEMLRRITARQAELRAELRTLSPPAAAKVALPPPNFIGPPTAEQADAQKADAEAKQQEIAQQINERLTVLKGNRAQEEQKFGVIDAEFAKADKLFAWTDSNVVATKLTEIDRMYEKWNEDVKALRGLYESHGESPDQAAQYAPNRARWQRLNSKFHEKG